MQEYITVEGETLAGIIYRYYGVANEDILRQVLDANQNLAFLPLILPFGTKIIMPHISVLHEIIPIALWS